MNDAIRIFRNSMLLLVLVAAVQAPAVAGDVSMNLGVRPQLSTWTVTDPDSSHSDSARSTQIALDFQVRRKSFYFAVGVAGGDYTFDGAGPARPDGNVGSDSETRIARSEVDLVFGYFFWRPVSFFIDLKNISNKWDDDDYKVEYNGLGLGVSANHAFSPHWAMFGSFGLMPVNIKDDSGKIGSGSGAALEAGALYAINSANVLTAGARTQVVRNTYDVDDDGRTDMKQNHRLNGLVFRYYHVF